MQVDEALLLAASEVGMNEPHVMQELKQLQRKLVEAGIKPARVKSQRIAAGMCKRPHILLTHVVAKSKFDLPAICTSNCGRCTHCAHVLFVQFDLRPACWMQ